MIPTTQRAFNPEVTPPTYANILKLVSTKPTQPSTLKTIEKKSTIPKSSFNGPKDYIKSFYYGFSSIIQTCMNYFFLTYKWNRFISIDMGFTELIFFVLWVFHNVVLVVLLSFRWQTKFLVVSDFVNLLFSPRQYLPFILFILSLSRPTVILSFLVFTFFHNLVIICLILLPQPISFLQVFF